MSELDKSIGDVEQELQVHKKPFRTVTRARNIKPSVPVIVLCLVVISVGFQVNTLTTWMFGLPDEKVQEDITKLLTATDDRLQKYQEQLGELPETLPADSPGWLIGYKKTLVGYKINTQVQGVSMELSRIGDKVTVSRTNNPG